jgi:hypothetical protein
MIVDDGIDETHFIRAWDRISGLDATASQKAVLKELTFYDRMAHGAHPSVETLAYRTGYSARTIQRAIHGLEDSSYLKVTERRDANGSMSSNDYLILLDPSAIHVDAPSPPPLSPRHSHGDTLSPGPVTVSPTPDDTVSPYPTNRDRYLEEVVKDGCSGRSASVAAQLGQDSRPAGGYQDVNRDGPEEVTPEPEVPGETKGFPVPGNRVGPSWKLLKPSEKYKDPLPEGEMEDKVVQLVSHFGDELTRLGRKALAQKARANCLITARYLLHHDRRPFDEICRLVTFCLEDRGGFGFRNLYWLRTGYEEHLHRAGERDWEPEATSRRKSSRSEGVSTARAYDTGVGSGDGQTSSGFQHTFVTSDPDASDGFQSLRDRLGNRGEQHGGLITRLEHQSPVNSTAEKEAEKNARNTVP